MNFFVEELQFDPSRQLDRSSQGKMLWRSWRQTKIKTKQSNQSDSERRFPKTKTKIAKMIAFVRIFLLIFLTQATIGVRNTCKNNCLTKVIRDESSNKINNLSAQSPVYEKAIEYDEWKQVIGQSNVTSDEEELPHYIVPKVSDYERGRVELRKSAEMHQKASKYLRDGEMLKHANTTTSPWQLLPNFTDKNSLQTRAIFVWKLSREWTRQLLALTCNSWTKSMIAPRFGQSTLRTDCYSIKPRRIFHAKTVQK